MTQRKNEKLEERSPDSSESQSQADVGSGSRIEGAETKKVYDKAFHTAHKDDQTPSQLDLPAQGNNFRITGEHKVKGSDGKTRDLAKPHETKLETQQKIGHDTEAVLQQKAKDGDLFARKFIRQREEIERETAPGHERQERLARVQQDIEEMFGRRDKTLKNGPLEEVPNQIVQKQDGSIQLNINAVENIPQAEANASAQTEQQPITTWQDAMKRISELPLEKQFEVIGKGLVTFNNSIENSKREIAIGTTIGAVQGVGNTLIGVVNFAQFTGDTIVFAADIATNNPRYLQTADKVGEAIGKTLVTGVKLFSIADAYCQAVDQSGDYAKPFTDLQTMGREFNRQWMALPERERARMAAQFTTEMGANFAPVVGASKLGKAEKLVETLEEIGSGVNGLKKIEAEEKYIKSVAGLIEDLDKSNFVRRSEAIEEKLPRQFPQEVFEDQILPRLPKEVSPGFVSRLYSEIDKMPSLEKFILKKLSDFRPLTALAAEGKDQSLMRTLGAFVKENDEFFIKIGEHVWQNNEWQVAQFIEHSLRHEIGHAFNVLFKDAGEALSDLPAFRRTMMKEFRALSQDDKAKLFSRFEVKDKSGKVIDYKWGELADEVFADTFAHARAKIPIDLEFNRLMGEKFKETTKLVDRLVGEIEKDFTPQKEAEMLEMWNQQRTLLKEARKKK